MERIRIKKWAKRKAQKSIIQLKERIKEKKKPVDYNFTFIIEEGRFWPVSRALVTALKSLDAAVYLTRLIESQNYYMKKRRCKTF